MEDGSLRKLNPRDGWLACRYNPDSKPSDGDGASDDVFTIGQRPLPALYADYQGDRHDAFWYFDAEMARLTESRYAQTQGKASRPIDIITYQISADGKTVKLNTPQDVHVEVISGPLHKVDNRTFLVYPYECGLDNPKRSYTSWLIAIREGDSQYKRSVRPIEIKLPNPLLK